VSYAALAEELRRTGLIPDPWIRGEPRFREEPVVVTAEEWSAATECAEAVAEVHDGVVRMCVREPELLESFFGLTPIQRAMFFAQAPAWHGIARADLFRTADGFVCCELNSDTPSGEAEAVVLGERAVRHRPDCFDPTARLADRFVALVRSQSRGPTIGIVYPTEMTEDLSMIALYRRWLSAAGARVVLGSPFNLSSDDDHGVRLLGERCDAIVRHYKTDWWSEREPVWDNAAPFASDAPLAAPLLTLLQGAAHGTCAVINPFGAVIAQNKRAMALMWERIDDFSAAAQSAIRRFIPRTIRFDREAARDRSRWVMKSDYGCEGAEVIVGERTTENEWRASIEHAIERRWVLQERFVSPQDFDAASENIGIYVVAGRASGGYVRIQDGPTDDRARSAALLVAIPEAEGP
jgi:glutathionylspermidine synthase